MTRRLGPVNIDQLPFREVHFQGNRMAALEPLCSCRDERVEQSPHLRVEDTDFSIEGPKAFEKVEVVLESKSLPNTLVAQDLVGYNKRYADSFGELDKLIRFAGAYFSSEKKQKDCRAITDGNDPPTFCAVTDFYDPLTGELVEDLREFHLDQQEPTLPFVVNYTDHGKKGERDAEDLITISIGGMNPEQLIQIQGDSPYAALFQNPFASPSPQK
ncbi:MAG: hypothetical protein Q7S98_02995 [Deltaproteobacteria bacterium]|nr:hypothetical protein [Deltaproteobacteria bacterium]